MNDEDAELRELFAQDARDRLDRMTASALRLEGDGPGTDEVAALFRDAHAIKGSAPIIGLHDVAETAHELENLLGEIRSGTRVLREGDTDTILAAIDRLRAMVAHGIGAEPLPADDEAPLPPPPPAPPSPADAASDERPPAPREPAARRTTDSATHPAPDSDAPSSTVPADPAASVPAPARSAAAEELIPVSQARLDRIVALAADAIAVRLRLADLLPHDATTDGAVQTATAALARALSSIQEEAIATRMTTLRTLEATLRRAVRDVARSTGKRAELRVTGEAVELDKAVLDHLRDPLVHLVRNAVDHGLEPEDARAAAGKPSRGTVQLDARRRGGEIVISIRDDGAGLDLDALRRQAGDDSLDDQEAAELVFRPGVSTADELTDISGRGVGMDAVRTTVRALRGRVSVITSRGAGTTFALTVPVTLAIVRCLMVQAGGERYALPAHAAATLIDDPGGRAVGLEGGSALWVDDDVVPLIALADLVGSPGPGSPPHGPAVVLRTGDRRGCALWVDAVEGHRDVTTKAITGLPAQDDLIAGASIEPNGAVVLVLDPNVLAERARHRRRAPEVAPVLARAPGAPVTPATDAPEATTILVVDDAITVRELQRSMLRRAGYVVHVATDGRDALRQLQEKTVDMVITDVDMPELDGIGLAQAIRADQALSSLPVLMVTSMDSEEDRRRGLEAGADAYVVKREFDEERLLRSVADLLGHAFDESRP